MDPVCSRAIKSMSRKSRYLIVQDTTPFLKARLLGDVTLSSIQDSHGTRGIAAFVFDVSRAVKRESEQSAKCVKTDRKNVAI